MAKGLPLLSFFPRKPGSLEVPAMSLAPWDKGKTVSSFDSNSGILSGTLAWTKGERPPVVSLASRGTKAAYLFQLFPGLQEGILAEVVF